MYRVVGCADVVWTSGDQASSTHAGSLPSVVRHGVRFFADGCGCVLGYLAPASGTDVIGSGATVLGPNQEIGTFPAVWADAVSGSGGTYAVFVPPVEDVELITSDEVRVRDLTVHEWGGRDGLLVLADVEGTRESVTEVRFTDPAGTLTGGPAPAH